MVKIGSGVTETKVIKIPAEEPIKPAKKAARKRTKRPAKPAIDIDAMKEYIHNLIKGGEIVPREKWIVEAASLFNHFLKWKAFHNDRIWKRWGDQMQKLVDMAKEKGWLLVE